MNEREQRRYLSEALELFTSPRYAWITQTFIYQLRDLVYARTRSSWGSGLGVVSRQLDPKPSYRTLASLTRP